MLTRDDLIDLIMRHLALSPTGKVPSRQEKAGLAPMLPRGRLFLSEHEIKKRLTPQGQHLKIPLDAILSPLACDWLVLKGIKIVRE